jgi:hypothetical protein
MGEVLFSKPISEPLPKYVTEGLEVYVDANIQSSYPGSGTTWFDISGNDYHFVANTNNMPAYETDANGKKYFRPTSLNTWFLGQRNSPFSGSFAISVYAVVLELGRDDYQSVISQGGGVGQQGMTFCSLDEQGDAFGTDHWQPNGRRTVSAHNLNQIYNVTWTIPTWSNHHTSTKIYLDAAEVATTNYSTNNTANLAAGPLRIGQWEPSRNDMWWNGRIYAIMVYNRVLTPQEIQTNYNYFKARGLWNG